MQLDLALIGIAGICLAVVIYHHVVYPLLLKLLGSRAEHVLRSSNDVVPIAELPSFDVIVPAYNEAAVIAEKVSNLAAIRYPAGKLRAILALDGCTDDTAQLARQAIGGQSDTSRFEIVEHSSNIGKIAVINHALARSTADLIALTDTSASVAPDALERAAAHFANPAIGVVCATYRVDKAGSEGERLYWDYQTRIKLRKSALAAPIGAHGAFYIIRRSLWQPLPPDTINDDFFIPMRIVLAGNRAIYDPAIVATEIEQTSQKHEFRRRIRIGAGNMQQLVRMPELLNPTRGYLAFLFVSGKGLRATIPFFLLMTILCLLLLILRSDRPLAYMILAALGVGGIGALAARARQRGTPAVLAWLGYFLEGHLASGLGGFIYLTQRRSSSGSSWASLSQFLGPVPFSVAISKRLSDLLLGGVLLLVFAFVLAPIALALKLSRSGPIFQREFRVGMRRSGLPSQFAILSFRTMPEVTDPGPDTQISRRPHPFDGWLRSTGLEALPQCLNVLRGEMAIVGPRPERPDIATMLENSIPAYAQRTHGLKPGLTGLAQVSHVSDRTIDAARIELTYDHAYAQRLLSWTEWLKTDLTILWQTIIKSSERKRAANARKHVRQ